MDRHAQVPVIEPPTWLIAKIEATRHNSMIRPRINISPLNLSALRATALGEKCDRVSPIFDNAWRCHERQVLDSRGHRRRAGHFLVGSRYAYSLAAAAALFYG